MKFADTGDHAAYDPEARSDGGDPLVDPEVADLLQDLWPSHIRQFDRLVLVHEQDQRLTDREQPQHHHNQVDAGLQPGVGKRWGSSRKGKLSLLEPAIGNRCPNL
jgi:hypothetical protein